MKKVFKSHSFWLMIIALDLLALVILLMHETFSWEIVYTEVFWVAISSIAAVISLICAVSTYFSSQKVAKKQATYNAYDKFKNDVFELENKINAFNLTKVLEDKKQADLKKKNNANASNNDEKTSSSDTNNEHENEQ